MRIRATGNPKIGQALDLRTEPIGADRLAAAISDPTDRLVGCPLPTAIHDHVGVIQPEMALDARTALACAARSRGITAPHADEIDTIEARIAEISPPEPDLQAARERAASAGESVDALREEVARLRGRLNAIREAGGETAEVQASLQEATRQLSEAETEAIAARQALAAAEQEARTARDLRAERLSLVDRRENLRRDARSWLVERMAPELENALEGLPIREPGSLDYADPEGDFPASLLALGIARIARLQAPVVLADGPFDTAVRARAALSAPVVLV